jgi:HK97 family phage major capsid protein
MDNQTLLAKADMALSDLTTGGGFLQPAQAQSFLRLLIKEAVLMKMATVVPMKGFKQQLNKIRFGSRIMRAGQEGTALPSADRAKPDLSQVELDVKLFKAQVDLTNEVLEDSIEQGTLRNTIMTLMGARIATDLDELLISGDTASSDTYLAQIDGVLKAATTNVVNAGTVTLAKSILRDMLKAMPTEFAQRTNALRYLTSLDAVTDYGDTIATRLTVYGDKQLENGGDIRYNGIPVMSVPMFPDNLGGGTNCTNALLLDPKNINVGIWRQIRFETDKDISAGVIKIVATMRLDMKFEHEPAVVKATNVKTQ